ncbi:PepSY-like domain-containing protein [bacterium]|nr:PepSY-like domain-containing protein [bacterium]
MKKFLFKHAILLLIISLCFSISCKKQEKKTAGEKAATENAQASQIPQAIMDALKARFPDAEIRKWTKEVEDGAVMYDIEFKRGDRNFEADVREDGTIDNWEKAIEVKDVPEAVLNAVEEKYPGFAVVEIMEISTIVDGKDVLQEYEIVFRTAEGKGIEVAVTPDGKIVEDSSEMEHEEGEEKEE